MDMKYIYTISSLSLCCLGSLVQAQGLTSSSDPVGLSKVPSQNVPKLDVLKDESLSSKKDAFFVGLKLGTLGLGIDAGYQINHYLKLRAQMTMLSYSRDFDIDDIRYKAKLNNPTAGLFLDIHPMQGSFRFTAGLMFAQTEIKADASPSENGIYDIGGTQYTGSDLGNINAKYAWNKVQPYIGIGWSASSESNSSFYFNVDLGVSFMGSGKLTYNVSNPGGTVSNGDIATEAKKFEDKIPTIPVYPVLMFGAGYRF